MAIQGARPSPLMRRGFSGLKSRLKHFKFPSINNKGSYPEYIGCKKRTQGTETSKYLQERTSTETPQVVASERGPGQWHMKVKGNKLESFAVAGDSPVHGEALYVPG